MTEATRIRPEMTEFNLSEIEKKFREDHGHIPHGVYELSREIRLLWRDLAEARRVLGLCKTKLDSYYKETGGMYAGGMEYSELSKLIDAARKEG